MRAALLARAGQLRVAAASNRGKRRGDGSASNSVSKRVVCGLVLDEGKKTGFGRNRHGAWIMVLSLPDRRQVFLAVPTPD